jgi:hypothetical protein
MRTIFRKLYRHQNLNEAEYAELMRYADGLRTTSIESYQLFYERFAAILFQDYYTYLPRFAYGSNDFFDYLLNNPSLLATLQLHSQPTDVFPPYLQEYLRHTYTDGLVTANLLPRLDLLRADNGAVLALPQPRQQDLVCKYEEANPYKEIGLKSHFDRIGRYSFVSRLQSVRYLRGNKASEDKIETVSSDCLGGVFTNKEKSIYYYLFLTEADDIKAENACQVLNQALYGNYIKG